MTRDTYGSPRHTGGAHVTMRVHAGFTMFCPDGVGIADAGARGALAKPAVGGGVRGGLQCPLCAAPLASPAHARRHLAAHYPRDSPVCPVADCARYFAHPNSVRNHMRIKHRRQWERMKTLKWSCGWAN
ncbi:hypothetical protein RR46_02467 [Papilio xuthus]|uniref:C2H2-type domain-containing protein n=1 Tax=Papilio xuthus TaxID=66420 RepID=A0A194QIL3_PAPXU|nr:hypothetical protein RR46_02467 [Papilio xuthus]